MDESTNTNPSGSKMGLIIGAIVLLLIAGGAYYFWSTQAMNARTNQAATAEDESEGEATMTEDQQMDMTPSSASGGAESATATMEAGNQVMTVEGGNFYFKPNEIKVKAGTPVKITLNNVQGFHDFVIDELDVKSKQITAGNTTTVEFTPDKKGSYEYYCSVGQHREMGMKGTLIVE